MPYKYFALLIITVLFFSCKNDDQTSQSSLKNEILIENLQKKNDSLKEYATQSEESLSDFMKAFNAILNNLEEIKKKENIISLTAQNMETVGMGKNQIQKDILLIYDLLQENKETVNNLREKLEADDMINEDMQKSIDMLSLYVERKNDEILNLRNSLQNMSSEMHNLNSSIDSLIATNKQQNIKLKAQDKIINTGYYIVGTQKELYEKGIITREGGIVGLGSVNTVNEHFKNNTFGSIKIDNTRKIPLNCKKAKLLSTHPAQAYKFDGPNEKINNLVITRPEKFWSTSRYLVVEITY
jgi:hypothetical protein